MSDPTSSGPPPTAASSASPVIQNMNSKSTDTWQYVVADPTTGHCIVLDPVRDHYTDQVKIVTTAADAIVILVERHDYVVDCILKTHAFGSQCLSAAWYLRMQFSIHQGWPPQLCDEATVSGLYVAWQRKYGAGNTFSTTICPGLHDGESVTLGWLSLTSMRMPGFGSPHRRAYPRLLGGERDSGVFSRRHDCERCSWSDQQAHSLLMNGVIFGSNPDDPFPPTV